MTVTDAECGTVRARPAATRHRRVACGSGRRLGDLFLVYYVGPRTIGATLFKVVAAVGMSAAFFVAANKLFDLTYTAWTWFCTIAGFAVGFAAFVVLDGNHVLRELPARPWLWGLIGGVVVGGAMFVLAALGPGDEKSASANPLRLTVAVGAFAAIGVLLAVAVTPDEQPALDWSKVLLCTRWAPLPSAPCGLRQAAPRDASGSPRSPAPASAGWSAPGRRRLRLVGHSRGDAEDGRRQPRRSTGRLGRRTRPHRRRRRPASPPVPTRRREDRAAVPGVDLRRAGPHLHRRRPADPARADGHPVAREQRQQRVRRHRELPDRDHEPRLLHGGELGLGQHLRQSTVLDRRRRHGHRPRHRPGQRARRPPPLRGDAGLGHRPAHRLLLRRLPRAGHVAGLDRQQRVVGHRGHDPVHGVRAGRGGAVGPGQGRERRQVADLPAAGDLVRRALA